MHVFLWLILSATTFFSLRLYLPPPLLSIVCECGDIRTLPADLFMIWLLISFTRTWKSASQIGPQASLCAHVHVCVAVKKQNAHHGCLYVNVSMFVCTYRYELGHACAITFACKSLFLIMDEIVTNCLCEILYFVLVKADLMMTAHDRVVTELSDICSHCVIGNSWQWGLIPICLSA